jgi:hypothetical protein
LPGRLRPLECFVKSAFLRAVGFHSCLFLFICARGFAGAVRFADPIIVLLEFVAIAQRELAGLDSFPLS